MEMGTTGGAIALIGSKPPAGAPVVDKVRTLLQLRHPLFTDSIISSWKQEPLC